NSYVIKQGIISRVAEFVETLKALEQKYKTSVKQKQLNLPIMNSNTMKNTNNNTLNQTSSSITTNNTQTPTITIPISTQVVSLLSRCSSSPISIYNVQQKYLEVVTNAGDKRYLKRKDEDVDEMVDETDDNNEITDDETKSIQNDNEKENTKSSSSLASPLTTIDTRLSLKRKYKSATEDSNRENLNTKSSLPNKKKKV
ncbi:unnamed protein product, partial [Didymodactylos carnosus]